MLEFTTPNIDAKRGRKIEDVERTGTSIASPHPNPNLSL